MRTIDFLIVGQGLAGSVLAIKLLQSGQRVLVIDEESPLTSSRKAAGIYNPITGRQMIKTWMADDLFPLIPPFYNQLEQELDSKFHYELEVYRPFFSNEESNDWEGKAGINEYKAFIKSINRTTLGMKSFYDPFGGLSVNLSGYVDLPVLIDSARKWISGKGIYFNELFMEEHLKKVEDGFLYKGDYLADKVIFCQGSKALNNSYWELPFRMVKGELLDFRIDLPSNKILNRGVFMLPREGIFRVGSTYDHEHLDYEPTEKGKMEIQDKMKKIYSGDAQLVNHTAGVRPATYDRRPFIGNHWEDERIGIFNGFGTKGVSLVPFFATQYINYLLNGGSLTPEADVKRVKGKRSA